MKRETGVMCDVCGLSGEPVATWPSPTSFSVPLTVCAVCLRNSMDALNGTETAAEPSRG